jgi:exosortase/archaeosortase family protein
MTATATVARPTLPRSTAALVLIAGGVALLFTESQLRLVEAGMAAAVMRLIHLADAHALGSTVFFVHSQQWIGYTVATGCTAALLIAPFFFIGAGLLFFRRLRVRNTLLALAVITVVIWLVNQLRLLLIGASMQLWGMKTGYDRSHVLAGGVLSTVGVVFGIVAFLAFVLRDREGPAATNHHRGDR